VIKEIQMVQQQYIIAELGDFDSMAERRSVANQGLHVDGHRGGAKEDLSFQKEFSTKIVDNTRKRNAGLLAQGGGLRVPRPSLGIFGSLSSQIIIKNPDIAENLNLQAQSTFRTVSLARPDMLAVLKMLLKAAGFHYYEKLARITHEFLGDFIRAKNGRLYGSAAGTEYVEQVTERLVMRDLKIAVRLAVLLRDQEWKGYLETIFSTQQAAWTFELQLYEKSLVEKSKELAI
jgi:hypothetical protein